MPRVVLIRVLLLRPWWHGAICVVARQTSLQPAQRHSKVSQPRRTVVQNRGGGCISPFFGICGVPHLLLQREEKSDLSVPVLVCALFKAG